MVTSVRSACRAALWLAIGSLGALDPARAQLSAPVSALDSLVAHALAVNPSVKAARARVDAARARIGAAGARPDPMLMAGIQNLPISSAAPVAHGAATPSGPEPMTMRMIGVSQTFPYPGKLALQTRSAREELAATGAELEAARLDVAASVKREYYELAYVDHALAIVDRTQSVLANLITVTEGQYSVGRGTQADVLRARVEAAHLGEQASVLLEQRRAVVARLNAALDRPSDASLGSAVVSERIARAAVPDAVAQVRFVSAALGARAADSPLVPLDSLQAVAVARSPMLRALRDRIDAQRARVALTRKAHLPDIDVAVSYGQRPGLPDMVSATVSIPLPIQKRRKQNSDVAAATADLAALEADQLRIVNELNAEIAERVSNLERARTQLALSLHAVLPQAQASLTSATSGYQVGRVEFTAVMDAQVTVFNAETTYFRALTDFAKGIAELERAVGAGVLR